MAAIWNMLFGSAGTSAAREPHPVHDDTQFAQLLDRGQREECFTFYNANDGQTYFLSNFYPSRIEIPNPDGGRPLVFPNVECGFHYLKFCTLPKVFRERIGLDLSVFTNPRTTGDDAYRASRAIQGQLSAHPEWTEAQRVWHGDRKVRSMEQLVAAKFDQNRDLVPLLEATRGYPLIEHNEAIGRDDFWSDNGNGTGKNMLGKVIQSYRDRTPVGDQWKAAPGYVRLLRGDAQRRIPALRAEARAVASAAAPLCKKCRKKPAYPKENGGFYDLCRRGCVGVCSLRGCEKDRYVDPTTRKVHDFCCRSHAMQAGALK